MRSMRNWLSVALVAGVVSTGAAVAVAQPAFRGGENRGGQDRGRQNYGGERGGRVQPVGPERYQGGRDYDRRDRDDHRDRDEYRGRNEYRGGGYSSVYVAPVYNEGYDNAYVPPCPGPGYIWAPGYWNNGYWIPGVWTFRGNQGIGFSFGFGHRDDDRHFDRDRHEYRGYDRDRR